MGPAAAAQRSLIRRLRRDVRIRFALPDGLVAVDDHADAVWLTTELVAERRPVLRRNPQAAGVAVFIDGHVDERADAHGEPPGWLFPICEPIAPPSPWAWPPEAFAPVCATDVALGARARKTTPKARVFVSRTLWAGRCAFTSPRRGNRPAVRRRRLGAIGAANAARPSPAPQR